MKAWFLFVMAGFKEQLHHIEAEYHTLADRFEAAGAREKAKAEAAEKLVMYHKSQHVDAHDKHQRAMRNAQKVRDFFA